MSLNRLTVGSSISGLDTTALVLVTHLECETIYDMTDASQVLVLVARPCIHVYADAGKMTWKGLGCHTDTIWQCGDLIKLRRILSNAPVSLILKIPRQMHSTFSNGSAAVARPLRRREGK